MAEIRIDHKTGLTKDQIREKFTELMSSVERRFDLTGRWEGDTYRFSRSGLDGSATATDGSVTITMKLGLLLGALKGRIESELRRELQEKLP